MKHLSISAIVAIFAVILAPIMAYAQDIDTYYCGVNERVLFIPISEYRNIALNPSSTYNVWLAGGNGVEYSTNNSPFGQTYQLNASKTLISGASNIHLQETGVEGGFVGSNVGACETIPSDFPTPSPTPFTSGCGVINDTYMSVEAGSSPAYSYYIPDEIEQITFNVTVTPPRMNVYFIHNGAVIDVGYNMASYTGLSIDWAVPGEGWTIVVGDGRSVPVDIHFHLIGCFGVGPTETPSPVPPTATHTPLPMAPTRTPTNTRTSTPTNTPTNTVTPTSTVPAAPCAFPETYTIPVAPSFVTVHIRYNDTVSLWGASAWFNIDSQAYEMVPGTYSVTLPDADRDIYSLSNIAHIYVCRVPNTLTPTQTPTQTATETQVSQTATATVQATPTQEAMPPQLPGGVGIQSCINGVDLYADYGGSNDVQSLYARRCDFGCPIDIDFGIPSTEVHLKAKLCLIYNYVYNIRIATLPIPIETGLAVVVLVLVIVYIIRRR